MHESGTTRAVHAGVQWQNEPSRPGIPEVEGGKKAWHYSGLSSSCFLLFVDWKYFKRIIKILCGA